MMLFILGLYSIRSKVLILDGKILAGHECASGGLITTPFKNLFCDTELRCQLLGPDFIGETDTIKLLFSETLELVFPGQGTFGRNGFWPMLEIDFYKLGSVNPTATLDNIKSGYGNGLNINPYAIPGLKLPTLLDKTGKLHNLAQERYSN